MMKLTGRGMRRPLLIGLVAMAAVVGATLSRADNQPAMRNALEHLQQAEGALMRSTSDKGGHRVNALAQVRAAIVEVRLGIRYDNRN